MKGMGRESPQEGQIGCDRKYRVWERGLQTAVGPARQSKLKQ